MTQQNSSAIYFTRLEIENIRSFGRRQELSLIDSEGRLAQWTLIVGDNNVGKTTLLQCLARMRPLFILPSDDGNENDRQDPVQPELAGEEENTVLESLARSGTDISASLKARLTDQVSLGKIVKGDFENIFTSLCMNRIGGELVEFKSGGGAPKNLENPPVFAYGAGRHPKTAYSDRFVAAGPINSLFRVEAALSDPEELLFRLEFGSLRKNQVAKRQLQNLKLMLFELLPDVENPEDIEVLGPPQLHSANGETGVQVKTPTGTVQLNQLSLGYRTMFSLAVDMAWKLLDHYPRSSKPLHEPAIVIIDEIDLHLHPLWQRKVRQHLTEHFPKVQFIATAHSPLMAQNSLDENLAVVRLAGEHAEVLNDPDVFRDWRLDQIVTSELYGLASARPLAVEAFMTRRKELIEKEQLSKKESEELEELDKRALDLPTAESPDDQRAMNLIRRVAGAIRESGES